MKQRRGFVSNSSSSSFVVVGFDAYDNKDVAKVIADKHGMLFEEINTDDYVDYDKYQYGKLPGENALCLFGSEGGLSAIGWDAKGDLLENQTVSQVRECLKKYLEDTYDVALCDPTQIKIIVGDSEW